MTDKLQTIREEVERLKSQLLRGACSSQIAMETMCKEEAYNEVLAILDTLQEEPVSEELEEAAKQYEEDAVFYASRNISDFFKAGAKWQETKDKQILNEEGVVILPEEEFERMKRSLIKLAEKEQQMMAKAIDGEVTYGKSLAIPSLGWVLDKEGLDFGDKIKLIIIKEN